MTLRNVPGLMRGALQAPADPPGRLPPVSVEAVTWAFRLFIGREPRDMAEIKVHLPHVSVEGLRIAFSETTEFQTFFRTIVKRYKPRYGLPPFMLRPPMAGVPWRFEPPSIDTPVCQICTASQFREPAFAEVSQALGMSPRLHRRVWEQVFVVSALATDGLVGPGKTAIGLGVERERVAALLGSRGVQVTAVGIPGRVTPRESDGGLHLFYPEILPLADFDQMVQYGEADLRNTPDLLGLAGGTFDCVWSCGQAQQMGRMGEVMDFLERAMTLVKPGGTAVHTFDFNIGSDEDTIETADFALPRRSDIEALLARLAEAGHDVLPLNLHPGHDPEDGAIDVAPFGLPHLKIEFHDQVVTSLGIIIRKRG